MPDATGFPAGTTTWSSAAGLPLCLLAPHMHERQIIDAAFASVGKAPMPLVELDFIVNLAFHTMLGGVVTVIPSHFELVIGAFPGTRIVKLIEPEVVREVGADLGGWRPDAANGESHARRGAGFDHSQS